jgi:branched-chain amino acid transport system permease protein
LTGATEDLRLTKPKSGLTLAAVTRLSPALWLGAFVCLLALIAGFAGGDHIHSVFTEALIDMVMVVGLWLFIGNSGIVSFGHISFALIGVYATAWQSCCGPLRTVYMPGLPPLLAGLDVPPILAATIGSIVAALAALAIGAAIMRLSGTAASIALLCLLFVVKTAYENWDSWTGGQSAIVGLPTFVDLPVACAAAVAAIIIATLYRTSSFGLRLRAVREDETAARAAGVNPWLQKVIAFTISAFVVAFGGTLYGHFLGTIAVSMYWLDMTFLTLTMLVVGGLRSLTGAVVGTLFVVLVRDLVQTVERGVPLGSLVIHAPEGTREIVLALVLLLILILRPQGIVGDWELGQRR